MWFTPHDADEAERWVECAECFEPMLRGKDTVCPDCRASKRAFRSHAKAGEAVSFPA